MPKEGAEIMSEGDRVRWVEDISKRAFDKRGIKKKLLKKGTTLFFARIRDGNETKTNAEASPRFSGWFAPSFKDFQKVLLWKLNQAEGNPDGIVIYAVNTKDDLDLLRINKKLLNPWEFTEEFKIPYDTD